MSTRANVVIKDQYGGELWFYRHSDGYPEGAMPTLKDFMKRVVAGEIRDNVSQAAGWLIVIGHEEYRELREKHPFNAWKVGAYEPTTEQHGDIQYLYVLDLTAKTIEICDPSGGVTEVVSSYE
jgi:hypothetical protein